MVFLDLESAIFMVMMTVIVRQGNQEYNFMWICMSKGAVTLYALRMHMLVSLCNFQKTTYTHIFPLQTYK